MTHRNDESNLPPIPDGGLSESMPEWLRRPPAWRTLKDSEVVQTRPAETATLPEPDTSVIDPREFLTDDDLPPWLRSLGRGRGPRAIPGDDDSTVSASPTVSTVANAPDIQPLPVARFVPRQPIPMEPTGRPTAATPRPVAGTRSRHRNVPRAWWQGASMVILLGSLLIIAIAVIVVLAVS
jgi:hypothetical protein